MKRNIFDKIWDEHVITERENGESLLYIDRHLIHDLHYRSFKSLKEKGLNIREPKKLFAVSDHSVPTTAKKLKDIPSGEMFDAVQGLQLAADEFKFHHFPMSDKRRGIVHVIGPEQGITLPGLTLVCGDSHTSTHGALGCIGFGIGSTEIEHVLATQTIWQRKPKIMKININGILDFGVGPKDVILSVIREISASGGNGYAIEFGGSVIDFMSMESRMTVCNMAIEAGARFGIIAPDRKTIDYCSNKPYAPKGYLLDEAIEYWKTLIPNDEAIYDSEYSISGEDIAPMVSWGNSPQWSVRIDEPIPEPKKEMNPVVRAEMEAALNYMDLTPGSFMSAVPIDMVFIGACTNSRIEDLRTVARVIKGYNSIVKTFVVPGSGLVKEQAEAEGLHKIFIKAGMEWREPGCSMCVALNGDVLNPGQRSASTSNRNFRGRQGVGSRTHLVSPAMAAVASITGYFKDVRKFNREYNCAEK